MTDLPDRKTIEKRVRDLQTTDIELSFQLPDHDGPSYGHNRRACEQGKTLAADEGIGFYSFIVAAMKRADTHNLIALRKAWPELWLELQDRYDAPGGVLEHEHSGEESVHRRPWCTIKVLSDSRFVAVDQHSAPIGRARTTNEGAVQVAIKAGFIVITEERAKLLKQAGETMVEYGS